MNNRIRVIDSFTNRLNAAMRIREMKQVDLVEKTGLGKSAISQYCSGIYEPKRRALRKLAEALNVNEAWLVGYDVPMGKDMPARGDDIKDCYPGFTITCKCGSNSVYVENTLGFSSPSGPWGSVDLVCNDCGYKIAIADPFDD